MRRRHRGGGFTGLWTAYFLKQRPRSGHCHSGKGHRRIRRSGSKRRRMLVLGDSIFPWLRDTQTREAAVRLQHRLIDTVPRIGDICASEGIDCHFAHNGLIMTAANEQRRCSYPRLPLPGKTRFPRARL